MIRELQEIGLDRGTLARLAADQQRSSLRDAAAAADLGGFSYHLDVDSVNGEAAESVRLRPRLTVFVHLENGAAVDATLSPPTRNFLQKLALGSTATTNGALSPDNKAPAPFTASSGSQVDAAAAAASNAADFCRVEVPLVFDAEFFGIIQTDVSNIRTLQEEEQAKLESQVVLLGEELGKAVDPSQGRRAKADLDAWRQIFELYLDARIFFSSLESDHGARTSTQAVEQLHWFRDQVNQRRLVQRLRLVTSHTAFNSFVSINTALLSILKFQEINRLAITKILKSMRDTPLSDAAH